jgi:hypothetical protein
MALQENLDPYWATLYGFGLSKGSGDTAEMRSMKCTKIVGKGIFNWSVTFRQEKNLGKNIKMW